SAQSPKRSSVSQKLPENPANRSEGPSKKPQVYQKRPVLSAFIGGPLERVKRNAGSRLPRSGLSLPVRRDSLGLRHVDLAIVNPGIPEINFQLRRLRQIPLNQCLGQRVLDVLLQRAAQWAGAVAAVGTGLLQDVAGSVGVQMNAKLLGRQIRVDLLDQQ